MIVDESLLEQQGDTWLARVSCDQELFGFVIGRGGQTKKRVEKETGSSLKIPDRHTEGAGEITITAPDAESAARGRAEVQELVNGAVASSRTDYNAFISLPLRTPAGEDSSSYKVLWSSLLADPEVAGLGVAEEMMTSPSTLHLTLGMLKLYSAELRERARKVLKQVQGEVLEMLDGQSLRVMLSGMRSMNGDLERTHVLYLQVKDMGTPGQVQQIADYVAQAFHAAGLVADGGSVKLHATVINSRYRKTVPAEPGAPRRRRPERVAFDARRIVDKYGALEVGPLLLSELHISQRRRFDEDGYYYCLGRADL